LPVKTLIDRLTNESNTWLNACRLEDVGNYADAIILYLNDATESIRIGSLVRAGLSCSCAADCLVKFKVEVLPKKLYFKAATIYMEIAKSAVYKSIRKWLWALQKAYENFVLAGETSMAESVLGEYMVLATKVQPSIREAKPTVLKSNIKTSVAAQTVIDLPERVIKAVNFFLEQQDFPLENSIRTTEHL
jgi:hypothetical protein